MQRYWFIYKSDGTITEPYLGDVGTWTNIPENHQVIGPMLQSNAKEAFENPTFYRIQNGALVAVDNINQLREEKNAKQNEPKPPSLEQQLLDLQQVVNDILFGGI